MTRFARASAPLSALSGALLSSALRLTLGLALGLTLGLTLGVAGCSAEPPTSSTGAVDASSPPADSTDDDTSAPSSDAGSDTSSDANAATDAGSADASAAACTTWSAPSKAGLVHGITELSGLARAHNGWLWGHNDSGETEARVFLIDDTARHRATLKLPGIKPNDWEDIAAGSCGADAPATPEGAGAKPPRCLWVGDIGDNGNHRSSVSLIRVLEPTTLPAATTLAQPKVEQWTAAAGTTRVTPFRYPSAGLSAAKDLRPDAESLAVLPDGRLLVLTKRGDGTGRLYRITPKSGKAATDMVTAVLLGTVDLRDPPMVQGVSVQATGAALVGDRRLLVRSYYRAWALDFPVALTSVSLPVGPPPSGLAGPKDGFLAMTRHLLTTGFDIQGESITGDGAGGFWHTSELLDQPLWHVACKAR